MFETSSVLTCVSPKPLKSRQPLSVNASPIFGRSKASSTLSCVWWTASLVGKAPSAETIYSTAYSSQSHEMLKGDEPISQNVYLFVKMKVYKYQPICHRTLSLIRRALMVLYFVYERMKTANSDDATSRRFMIMRRQCATLQVFRPLC